MHAYPLLSLLILSVICQVAAYPELFAARTSNDCHAFPKRAYGSHRQPQPDSQAILLQTHLIFLVIIEASFRDSEIFLE
jgi:hypothetical protein